MKQNVTVCLRTATGFLLVFLAGKWILNQNPGLSFWEWMTDTTPWHHSYLFGWLVMKKRFLTCAVISSVPALWNWKYFSTVSMLGFAAGLLAGECYHFLFWTSEQQGIPDSWVIWLLTYLVAMVIGLLLQVFRRKK